MIVVAAYGKILPKNVIDYPEYGCINVHGSLLPEYRGAAPVQRAIIDGRTVTGITIMYMAEGLDTGDSLRKRRFRSTKTTISERFSGDWRYAGRSFCSGLCRTFSTAVQNRKNRTAVLRHMQKKIEKADCVLDFSMPAKKVHDLIRGLSPAPLASASLCGRMLKPVTSRLSDTVSGRASRNRRIG